MRPGWVSVVDGLSDFHRVLVAHIPKYQDVAVRELALPATRYDIPVEERALLPACADCPVVRGGTCSEQEELVALGERVAAPRPPVVTLFRGELLLSGPSAISYGGRWVPAVPWSIEFRDSGRRGEQKTICMAPQVLFQGHRIEATDTREGLGTKVGAIFVGCRLQKPVQDVPVLSRTVAEEWDTSGYRFDVCDKALSMAMIVHFLENCDFSATISGRAAP